MIAEAERMVGGRSLAHGALSPDQDVAGSGTAAQLSRASQVPGVPQVSGAPRGDAPPAPDAQSASGPELVPGAEPVSGPESVPCPQSDPGPEPVSGPESTSGAEWASGPEPVSGPQLVPGPQSDPGPEPVSGAEWAFGPESDSGAPRVGDPVRAPATLRFSVGDLAEWVPERPVDVIFSHAALQWVPEHRELLPRWVRALAPGGRLAFGMPGNFDGPSHRILRELCESPRWRDRLGEVNRHNVVGDPAEYFELLSDLGCAVDAWETTYLQVLHGVDPVLEWMKGTALRPAFDALPDEREREEFSTELAALLREAYPAGPHGTLFPFRRIFVIAGPPT
jgi:trans-aconitate 2-methyltransferase